MNDVEFVLKYTTILLDAYAGLVELSVISNEPVTKVFDLFIESVIEARKELEND